MNGNDQEYLVQKIRAQYTEKEHTRLDALKELDAKVKRPANVFACVFGSVGAIIMGSGMSLIMTELGASIGMENAMIPGVALGMTGMLMTILNYPIYKKILGGRKSKYAGRIMQLSDTIMGNA